MRLDLTGAAARVAARLPEYLRDLDSLASIDSGTYDKVGVDQVASMLSDRYDRLGARVSRHRHDVLGDTIVAELGASGPVTLLLGHTDTVYPAGTAAMRPMRREGDLLFGPGTADMKAGALAIVYALEDLVALDANLGRVIVIHNSDEEIGSPSSRGLIRQMAETADAVLVLEPGRENGNIVAARKGIARVDITVRGVAAHAGVNHNRGRSAILELAYLVTRLEALNGIMPDVTLNVGVIQGGERVNVVPDHASAEMEIRALEPESLQHAVELVRETVAWRTIAQTNAEADVRIEHWPMHRTAATNQLVVLAQGLGADLGLSITAVATGGASDGNTAAQAGKPVLDGLGPVGGNAHSPDEYIDVTSVAPRVALLEGLVEAIASGSVTRH